MATIGTTSRPSYVYDQDTDTWVPVGVGPHTHENFVTATTIDAKGDLLAGLSPDTVGRLPIGANGTLLVADSTQTLGMAWSNTLTAATASTVPLTLKGAVSQSSNLFNATDSGNNFLFSILPTGRLDWNTVGTYALTATSYRADNPASTVFRRSRSNTFGVNTALVSTDGITNFQAFGADGTGFALSSGIYFIVDGTVSTGIVPGAIHFNTSPVTGGSLERMRIDSTGLVTVAENLKTTKGVIYNINPQTGTSYTAAIADGGSIVTTNNAAANTFFINTNAAVPFAIGTSINIIQIGTGTTTIQATTSGTTTVASNAATSTAPKLRTQYSSATAIKISNSPEVWYVVGDIV
jgi:hypothetical protein